MATSPVYPVLCGYQRLSGNAVAATSRNTLPENDSGKIMANSIHNMMNVFVLKRNVNDKYEDVMRDVAGLVGPSNTEGMCSKIPLTDFVRNHSSIESVSPEAWASLMKEGFQFLNPNDPTAVTIWMYVESVLRIAHFYVEKGNVLYSVVCQS